MSAVGPGRQIPETKEIIHHHYSEYPSGEMNPFTDSDEDEEKPKKKSG